MTVVTLRLLNTGFCTVRESLILAGGRREAVRLPALVGLIHHPDAGWLLFDTGYAPRVWEASAGWPYAIYRHAAPFDAPPERAVVAQLPRHGLTAGDIGTVVLSHFHPDHAGGLRDFPDARIVATRNGYDDVRERRGWRALTRAFLPGLLPDDFADRATLLDPGDFNVPVPGLAPAHDLRGDGSLLLVPLPGHAVGQVGLLARTADGPAFLVADAAYLRRSVTEFRPAHPATGLFSESRAATLATLRALHEFSQAHPEVALLPAHCPETEAERGANPPAP